VRLFPLMYLELSRNYSRRPSNSPQTVPFFPSCRPEVERLTVGIEKGVFAIVPSRPTLGRNKDGPHAPGVRPGGLFSVFAFRSFSSFLRWILAVPFPTAPHRRRLVFLLAHNRTGTDLLTVVYTTSSPPSAQTLPPTHRFLF